MRLELIRESNEAALVNTDLVTHIREPRKGDEAHPPASLQRPADELRHFEALVVGSARAFVRVAVDNMDAEINLWLKRIVLTLGLDRSTIAEISPETGWVCFTHGWAREQDRILPKSPDPNTLLPWTKRKILAGETVVMSSPDNLPKEAGVDRKSFYRYGPKSNVMVPIKVGGAVVGAVSFASLYQVRRWTPRIVQGLQAVAELFGYALERKRAVAEMLHLRNELAYVSRVTTMGELAASITHELNQPLAAILSNAEAIESILASDHLDLDEAKAGIGDIIHDCNRAAETIRRLRALFRHGECTKSKVDLARLLRETARIVQSETLVRNISFILDVREALPPVVAERVQLQQVIINLILNAFDAVAAIDDGPRDVCVSAVTGGADYVRIFVRDSGKGIAPEAVPKIFDAFFTTKPNGMGMGLAIAKSIVEAHGGQLCVSPNADRGATFEIKLPISAGTTR
jgi:signal transduction histidine kinase